MWQPCPTIDLSGGQFFVAMRWRWSFFEVIRYRCFLDTLSHVTIATDAIIWTSPSLIICFFHRVLLVFRIFQGIFLVVYGFWLFKVCCRQRCNFLLNHQDRCFWGSLTIVCDYFWSGLHKSCQPASLAVKKWKGSAEKMRNWREIYSLHFLTFSLFPPSISISYIKSK